jgi:hypothetical protein
MNPDWTKNGPQSDQFEPSNYPLKNSDVSGNDFHNMVLFTKCLLSNVAPSFNFPYTANFPGLLAGILQNGRSHRFTTRRILQLVNDKGPIGEFYN